MPRRRGYSQRRPNDNFFSAEIHEANDYNARIGTYTVTNHRTSNPSNKHPFPNPQHRPYDRHHSNHQRSLHGFPQYNTRSLNSYDHHFLLRSKRLKQHLIHSTDQTLREIQQWLSNQRTRQDENEMDWQPELEQAIPQLAVVVRYPWDLPEAEVADVCVHCKKSIGAGIGMGLVLAM